MIFCCKIRSSRQTPRNIQMKSMNRKKLFLSSLALLTITPVLRASCTEIAQKNNEDLVNSGNAGEGGRSMFAFYTLDLWPLAD